MFSSNLARSKSRWRGNSLTSIKVSNGEFRDVIRRSLEFSKHVRVYDHIRFLCRGGHRANERMQLKAKLYWWQVKQNTHIFFFYIHTYRFCLNSTRRHIEGWHNSLDTIRHEISWPITVLIPIEYKLHVVIVLSIFFGSTNMTLAWVKANRSKTA